MVRQSRILSVLLAALFLALQFGSGVAFADKKEELLKKIQKLEEEKAKIRQKAEEQQEKNKPTGKNLLEIIDRYEKILDGCSAKKSSRCADVIFTLASLYYDQGRDEYIQRRQAYEEEMDAYEKNPRGRKEPVNPVPDYSKSLSMYERLDSEYPEFPKLSEAFYQMGTIYLLMGDLDKTKDVFEKLIERFPNSPRASGGHFRLSDLCYLNHDNPCAIKHLEMVKEQEVDVQTWEMVHYRKAEIYYNMGEFDKAIDLFYSYVENCDKGRYIKKEFREIALEYMAISFSDMGNGAQEAINFFKKIGPKPYEAYVIYTIGMKNRSHGQFDDAIVALQSALKRFPYYKDAPVARQMLIECYVVKKENDKANEERVRLVDDYGQGSEWYKRNQDQRAVIEQSRNEVKRALSSIAIYYHALAQKTKDRSAYEKALKRYQEFFTKFPDDKWRNFELRYNVAEIYNSLGDCEKSAENYNFVAMEDLKTYPEYKSDLDTLGMDQDDVEKKKSKVDRGPIAISQEDAGYNVIVALENCRKKAIARAGVSDEQAYNLPETKKMLEYADKFYAKFPKSSNAAEVLYLAGNIHYGSKNYNEAIRVFKLISESFANPKITEKSLRMLANCYSSAGQYELAMSMYRQLLAKQKSGTVEYAEVLDLAAGAMFKRAENIKKGGNSNGAIDAFKSIYNDFPTSKVADRGWFEAGVCYEEMKNYDNAGATFEELPTKFPKSPLREKSFLRAAENYKKMKDWNRAAQVYQTAANTITKSDFAIGAYAQASECYQQMNQFDMAGRMYEMIFSRYQNDPKTPQALYNAGLVFEKGKFYENAIKVYDILVNRFPNSEYASEAFFSIGLCYEKMDQSDNMAGVFIQFAQKFTGDRYKQVQAYVKAGDAYYKMRRLEDAEKNYLQAVSLYEKYHKDNDMDISNIAQAYYKLGEVYYARFDVIKLVASNEKDQKNLLREKTKLLQDLAKYYAKAIEIGVEEWTLKSTYMIGISFVSMAEAEENRSLFGNQAERIGAKVKILSSLDKYYEKAQTYFYQNIEWARAQNIQNETVDKSTEKFMEMLFKRGYIMEEVGRLLKSAPVPSELSPDEKIAYEELLEEKYLEALDAALPKYEEGVRAAQKLGVSNSAWLEKIRSRIREINPNSNVLTLEIKQWQPDVSKVSTSKESKHSSSKSPTAKQVGYSDDQLDRNLSRIQNIERMNISVEQKIRQFKRIEMDAKRNILMEEEKISELRAQLSR